MIYLGSCLRIEKIFWKARKNDKIIATIFAVIIRHEFLKQNLGCV